jgi:hypothetical protein
MQFGIFSVSDVTRDPVSGSTPSEADRIRAIVEIARRADEVGLDVFAIGEHHNPPFFSSSPTTLLDALTLPTSVFAAPEDWGSAELGERIDRAATELAVAVHAGMEHGIAERAWSGYQHQFAGNATRAEQTGADIDFDTPLMRLAAGGKVKPDNAKAEY